MSAEHGWSPVVYFYSPKKLDRAVMVGVRRKVTSFSECLDSPCERRQGEDSLVRNALFWLLHINNVQKRMPNDCAFIHTAMPTCSCSCKANFARHGRRPTFRLQCTFQCISALAGGEVSASFHACHLGDVAHGGRCRDVGTVVGNELGTGRGSAAVIGIFSLVPFNDALFCVLMNAKEIYVELMENRSPAHAEP